MTEDQKAFEVWLEGKPWQANGRTRREFAKDNNIELSDLCWAFCSGYMQGRQDKREENKNV